MREGIFLGAAPPAPSLRFTTQVGMLYEQCERNTTMRVPMIAARLGSAGLLLALGLGSLGVGTAAAASGSPNNAAVTITANPASAPSGATTSNFSSSFVATNLGSASARDLVLTMTYDPTAVQLEGVQFDRSDAWVTTTSSNSFQADLGTLGSRGDAIKMTTSFKTLSGYKANTPIQAQVETLWRDPTGTSDIFNSVPLLVTAPSVASTTPPASTGGVVNVAAGGFNANEAVKFWYNLPDGSAQPLYLHDDLLVISPTHKDQVTNTTSKNVDNDTELYADANGQISTSFAASGLAPGFYSIVAYGTASGVTVSIPFQN